VFFWRPRVPRPTNHTFSRNDWFLALPPSAAKPNNYNVPENAWFLALVPRLQKHLVKKHFGIPLTRYSKANIPATRARPGHGRACVPARPGRHVMCKLTFAWLLGLIMFAPWSGPGIPQIRSGRAGREPFGPPTKHCLKQTVKTNRRRKPLSRR
jgi:hypothetical protein